MDTFIFTKTASDDDHKEWIDILSMGEGTTGPQSRSNNVFGFEDLPSTLDDEDDDLPVVIVWDIDGM